MASKSSGESQNVIDTAAQLLLDCDALFITTGAGMGVGSGLGTFRGVNAGVWPPLEKHPELDFTDMSNPSWFTKPEGNSDQHNTANFGYAFWSFRYNCYTTSAPHNGYTIVKQWSEMPHIKSSFSFTSNIDGHWVKSGWDPTKLIECHGTIDFMQCVHNCTTQIWPTNGQLNLRVDPKTDCVTDPLPLCPNCNKLARPNVLMFGDWSFNPDRHTVQNERYQQFIDDLRKFDRKLLIIELGAGTAVPTVRWTSEQTFLDSKYKSDFIRINPVADHAQIPQTLKKNNKQKCLEITADALTALTAIDQSLKKKMTLSSE